MAVDIIVGTGLSLSSYGCTRHDGIGAQHVLRPELDCHRPLMDRPKGRNVLEWQTMTPPLHAYRAGRLLDDGDPRAQFVRPVVIDHGNTSYPVRRNHRNGHLDRHSSATPARAAFRFMGATTTWRQLHDRVCGLADAMARRGIGFW